MASQGSVIRAEKAPIRISLVCIVTDLLLTTLFFHVPGPGILFSATLGWMGLILGSSLFAFVRCPAAHHGSHGQYGGDPGP